MKSIKVLGLAFVFLLLSSGLVTAASTVRTGETISIAADQSVAGDFYGFGNSVAISGSVDDDLLLMAGTVNL
ncbi:MAG: hypothetical protein R3B53_02350, partial [Candidatus Paceibacterota bacterium]